MRIEYLPISKIVHPDYNPRVTLVPEQEEYRKIKESLAQFGQVEPLVVNDVNNHCVGGNQRLNVLQDIGETQALCSVIHEPDAAREMALCAALNKIKGRWDEEKLLALLKDDDVTQHPTGYGVAEIEEMLSKSDIADVDAVLDDEEEMPESDLCNAGTRAKIGDINFDLTYDEFKKLVDGIRAAGIYDDKGIKNELKRRVLR